MHPEVDDNDGNGTNGSGEPEEKLFGRSVRRALAAARRRMSVSTAPGGSVHIQTDEDCELVVTGGGSDQVTITEQPVETDAQVTVQPFY